MFPEFIKDILVLVEGHKLIDITDGPGDEKQDILTITPKGKRCLTQCKHSNNHRNKYSGDFLDLLFSGSIRKNCEEALFVTNGDLTTQAKRYISDLEYIKQRISPRQGTLIDYWNGYRIWEKLQTNSTILNKWFGNMGQVHGLRNFSFEITLFQLPYHQIKDSEAYEKILSELLVSGKIEPTERKAVYKGFLNKNVSFTISRSHQFQSNFDINYLSPEDDKRYVNKPLNALAIAVTIDSAVAFKPPTVRKQILSHLLNAHLPRITPESWWHIISGRITSFVFIHDIKQCNPISVGASETFIKTNTGKVTEEKTFCKITREGKQSRNTVTDFKYKVTQYFTQRREPFDEFNYAGIQFSQHLSLSSCSLKTVGILNVVETKKIIKLLPRHWLSFSQEKILIWSVPENEEASVLKSAEENISLLGFQIFMLDQKAKAKVIENTQMHLPDFIVHDQLEMLRFPIDLTKRKFIISSSFSFNHQAGLNLIERLIQFKISYERHWGWTSALDEKRYSYKDLTDILFQPDEVRGEKMFDISIWENPIKIVMQFSKCPIRSTKEVVRTLINEFKGVESLVLDIFESQILKRQM